MNHYFIRYAQLALAICALFGVHSLGSERQPNIVLLMGGDNGTSTDGALGAPHRGVKSQMYEGGILVPGLIEWPARIPQPRVSTVRANTSDLLPTICGLTGQPLPNRPLDGVDLSDALDGK